MQTIFDLEAMQNAITIQRMNCVHGIYIDVFVLHVNAFKFSRRVRSKLSDGN